MANNRVGFVHRLALIYLAQLGPCSGQVSTSIGGCPRRGPLKGAQESNLPSSEIDEARALCAKAHHTLSSISICNDAELCQSGKSGCFLYVYIEWRFVVNKVSLPDGITLTDALARRDIEVDPGKNTGVLSAGSSGEGR